MPYDAVLDYNGVLYRVEVKGSSGTSFSVTRGSRSGKQISRDAESSRTRVLSREDCDFVICVDSNKGDCYIVPEDVIEIIGNNSLGYNALKSYREKWKLFMYGINGLTKEQTRDGLRGLTQTELMELAERLGIDIPVAVIKADGTMKAIEDEKGKIIYTVWREIAKRI